MVVWRKFVPNAGWHQAGADNIWAMTFYNGIQSQRLPRRMGWWVARKERTAHDTEPYPPDHAGCVCGRAVPHGVRCSR
ncbi:hypothetical protein CSR02_10385 [Acetobacter pomorum]|uniref:Uncharacterized protein n=1 Tax=Acetobacter pomorum TaxID=65959 RepID=A0A2G4RCD0_9PROT|nr:hypothetical protein CSR02_10385 [Acetobacter pomorum]